MKNGLYSVHMQMGDGVKGRASGIIVLRDGVILGGDSYFWSVGSYTFGRADGRAIWSPTSTHLPRQHRAPGFRRPGGYDGLFRNLQG